MKIDFDPFRDSEDTGNSELHYNNEREKFTDLSLQSRLAGKSFIWIYFENDIVIDWILDAEHGTIW